MQFREMMAFLFQNFRKLINTQYVKHAEFLMLKRLVHVKAVLYRGSPKYIIKLCHQMHLNQIKYRVFLEDCTLKNF